MDQAKKLHQILYTEIRRVPKGQRIFLGELISGGGDQPPWPSWTEGMLAPYDCIVYERSESLLDQRAEAAPTRVECDPKLSPKTVNDQEYLRGKGWRLIGSRRAKYGAHYYWDRWDGLAWSAQFIQGDALRFQRGMDKAEKRAALTARMKPATTRSTRFTASTKVK